MLTRYPCLRSVGLCLVVAIAAAQALAAPPSTQPHFGETIEVRLLEIDAHVVDREGKPVHGLTVGDFILFEDGKRVDVESVYEVRAFALAEPSDGKVLSPPTPVTRYKPRTIVFFVDQLPWHAVEREKVFTDLAEFTRNVLREGDTAAVIGWALEARTIVPLTRDRDKVVHTLEAFARRRDSIPDVPYNPRALVLDDLVRAFEEGSQSAQGWNFDVEQERLEVLGFCAEEILAEARRKSAVMKSIVSALRGDRTSALVYVSNRLPENTAIYCGNLGPRGRGAERGEPLYSTMKLLRDLGETANEAGVTLYSLRPYVPKRMGDATESGLPGQGPAAAGDSALVANELASLGTLADATGGIVGYSPKEIEVVLETIEQDLDSYYSIAYRATSDGRDRTRRIRVEAKDPSLTVRARRTIVDKSDLTSAKDALISNLYGVADVGQLRIDARVLGETTRRKRRIVHCEVRFRPEYLTFVERGDQRLASYRLLLQSANGFGELSDLTEMPREIREPDDLTKPVSIELDLEMRPEGTITAIGLLDEVSGLAGFATVDTRVKTGE